MGSPTFTLAALYVAVGGALGSVLRFAMTVWLDPMSRAFPLGTLAVNVSGSFAITFLGTLTLPNGQAPLTEGWRLALLVGLCGGFTTFSSFSLQTLDLARAGMPWRALANIALSVCLCLGSAAVGYYLGSRGGV